MGVFYAKPRISLRQVTMTLAALAMLLPLHVKAQDWFGDVDLDGNVNIADVTSLIDHLLAKDPYTPFNPYGSYLSAKEYGAIGDGETDDTQALENLFDAAFRMHKAIYFEPGTYLIRRALTLRTGMEIYGDSATIKKREAVTTSLTEAASKHQTYINVASTSGFNEGDMFVIVEPDFANQCTFGIVTSIEGNRINFTNVISDQQSNFPGCIRNYVSGRKVTTAFALLRSWSPRFDCDGVYIHDITLDGNRKSSEPKVWSNSCIHMDAYYPPSGYTGDTGIDYRHIQRNLIVNNVTIKNSPHDGISDQGLGGLHVSNCTIENPAVHGVHMGTRYSGGVITGNKMTGNGTSGAGVFLCQSVVNVIVENNEISKFNHGVSDEEFATCGKFTIVRNNKFKNITSYVFDFLKASSSSRGGGHIITDNSIEGLKAIMFSGKYLDYVTIANNTVSSITTVPTAIISITQSDNVLISGNKLPSGTTVSEPVRSTDTTNLIESSNSWN